MTLCRLALIAEGESTSNICRICGSGPCKKGYTETYANELANEKPQECFLVENKAGKRVVTFTEKRANFLATLIDGSCTVVTMDID